MGVYTFVCRRSGGDWTGKQHKGGDLEASAASTYELQRKLVQTVLSSYSSGGVKSSFSYVSPNSAVFQVVVGGDALVGGGGVAGVGLYTMASTSTNEYPVHITLACADDDLHLEATSAMLLELNFSSPFVETYYVPFVTIRIMSMVIMYCRHHDGEFIKLADPVTLLNLMEAAYGFDHKNLIDLACQTLVSMVKGKSVEEIRTNFIIKQSYDRNSTERPSKRPTLRIKEAFIMPPNFDFVQRSRRATKALQYIYNGRWKSMFDHFVGNLLKRQNDADMLHVTRALASFIKDQELARRLEHRHVDLLFNMLEQRTHRLEIKKEVLYILSRVNFTTAHEKAMVTARFQLLVKAIDEEVFGIYSNEMAPLAVLTLTNIVEALPKFVVHILKTGVLKRMKRVLLAPHTVEIVKCIALFLVAVCRTGYLSCLDKDHKVDLALATLQVLELRVSFKHNIEQACNAFQYLTYGMKLQIEEESALKKLIEKLTAIIQKPPPGNCQFPGYALGVIGNIAIWGSPDQIKILASNSTFLESLVKAMIAPSKKIQKEACLIISKIAVKMEGLIEEMHSARLIEALCGLLEKDEFEKDESEDADVKMDAAWAIYSGIYGSFFSGI